MRVWITESVSVLVGHTLFGGGGGFEGVSIRSSGFNGAMHIEVLRRGRVFRMAM